MMRTFGILLSLLGLASQLPAFALGMASIDLGYLSHVSAAFGGMTTLLGGFLSGLAIARRLFPATFRCRRCGATRRRGTRFCTVCGSPAS